MNTDVSLKKTGDDEITRDFNPRPSFFAYVKITSNNLRVISPYDLSKLSSSSRVSCRLYKRSGPFAKGKT